MKSFDEYTTRAINRYGLAGNNALARELGVNKSSISQMSAGKIYPAESTMIKLAELAGLPKEEALIDLNMWRSKDKPELQKVWQRISKMIGCLLMILLLSSICITSCFARDFTPVSPTPQDSINLYYATKVREKKCGRRQVPLFLLCVFSVGCLCRQPVLSRC